MAKAIKRHTTSRRILLASGAAILTGAVAAPAAADDPDGELVALCGLYCDIEDRFSAAYRSCTDDAEEERLDREFGPLKRHQDALLDRIVALRASTLAGLAARSRMIVRWEPGFADTASGNVDERMIAALLRDGAAVGP